MELGLSRVFGVLLLAIIVLYGGSYVGLRCTGLLIHTSFLLQPTESLVEANGEWEHFAFELDRASFVVGRICFPLSQTEIRVRGY